jgi:hypothetical protein
MVFENRGGRLSIVQKADVVGQGGNLTGLVFGGSPEPDGHQAAVKRLLGLLRGGPRALGG